MRLANGTELHAQAILFDMDGTLVDSTAVVERLWRNWAGRHGIDPASFLKKSHGRRTIETLAMVAPHLDIEQEAKSLEAQEITTTDGIIAVPGAASLLADLPRERWAVVTSASRELAEVRIRAAGLPIPDILVSAEEVTAGKPDPQGYLLAAQKIGQPAANCLVIEDARPGFEAGRRAGMRVLGLATTLSSTDLDGIPWIPDFRSLHTVSSTTASGITFRIDSPASSSSAWPGRN
jgi:sugar-phosphatase